MEKYYKDMLVLGPVRSVKTDEIHNGFHNIVIDQTSYNIIHFLIIKNHLPLLRCQTNYNDCNLINGYHAITVTDDWLDVLADFMNTLDTDKNKNWSWYRENERFVVSYNNQKFSNEHITLKHMFFVLLPEFLAQRALNSINTPQEDGIVPLHIEYVSFHITEDMVNIINEILKKYHDYENILIKNKVNSFIGEKEYYYEYPSKMVRTLIYTLWDDCFYPITHIDKSYLFIDFIDLKIKLRGVRLTSVNIEDLGLKLDLTFDEYLKAVAAFILNRDYTDKKEC